MKIYDADDNKNNNYFQKLIIFQAVGYLKINSNDLQLYEVGTTIVLILKW